MKEEHAYMSKDLEAKNHPMSDGKVNALQSLLNLCCVPKKSLRQISLAFICLKQYGTDYAERTTKGERTKRPDHCRIADAFIGHLGFTLTTMKVCNRLATSSIGEKASI